MGMVTQEAHFRQRVLNYAAKHGVTAAAIQYHMSRKTVHKWKKRYDGTVESLQDLLRTPHHFPRQQTAAELKLVKRYAKKCKGDPLLGYENASKHGYNRSYGCFKKTARKLLQPEAKKRKKRKNKPYQRAEYPDGLDILHSSSMGRLQQLVLRGNADEIRERLAAANPLFVDTVPLTLEEIFIYELGGADDEIKDIVL